MSRTLCHLACLVPRSQTSFSRWKLACKGKRKGENKRCPSSHVTYLSSSPFCEKRSAWGGGSYLAPYERNLYHFNDFMTAIPQENGLLYYFLSVINCTTLTVASGGPLRMNRCGNHFGSKCNFSCAVGHRLNGSSALTCVAPGNRPPGFWDHSMPFCEGLFYLFFYLQATSFLVLDHQKGVWCDTQTRKSAHGAQSPLEVTSLKSLV